MEVAYDSRGDFFRRLMSASHTVFCDLLQSNVTISNDIVKACHPGTNVTTASNLTVHISGISDVNSIAITNSTVTVILQDITANNTSPFLAKNSTVIVVSRGTNKIIARDGSSAGVQCDDSWLTFDGSGTLSATGGENGAGIGSGPWGSCDALHFVNGTYWAVGGTQAAGIGGGFRSNITEIVIVDGVYSARSLGGGAGIGSGAVSGANGTSSVGRIEIVDGRFNVSSSNGAGIGSGTTTLGSSLVGSVLIRGGVFLAKGTPGIGSGHSHQGTSLVTNVTIVNGSFSITGGIGAGSTSSRGTAGLESLTIEDGLFDVIATNGAGIGSGEASTGTSFVGTIAIGGGVFVAQSVKGAGLGTGNVDAGSSLVGELLIRGGSIIATSTLFGAGIGTGYTDTGTSRIDTILFENGHIRANGSRNGAGIGTGCSHAGNTSIGRIIFCRGVFSAVGRDSAAGIGTGYSRFLTRIDEIIIEGGNVSAESGANGAGIGTGFVQTASGSATIGRLEISGGNISASGADGAGIGAGFTDVGKSTILELSITGGSIRTIGNGHGAGIGTGHARYGSSRVSNLLLGNAEFDIQSKTSAGIGTGYSWDGSSEVSNITLTKGVFSVEGALGIGATDTGRVGSLSFGNANVSLSCLSAGAWCVNTETIRGNSAYFSGVTTSPRFVSPAVVWDSTFSDIIGTYRARSEEDQFGPQTMLHLGYIERQSIHETVTFTTGDFLRRVVLDTESRGVIVALLPGTYHVTLNGTEMCYRGQREFPVEEGEAFYESVSACTEDTKPKGGLAVEVIIGISVGAAMLVVAIIVLIVLVRKRALAPKLDGLLDSEFPATTSERKASGM
jgi:hypothetical protein